MKLYDLELSGHAHRARLFASLLGLDVQLVPVDLLNGAHKSEAYLAKNPFGQVPVLEDGDVLVTDSNAILVYLAKAYDTSGTWLPQDANGQAQVQVWLSKAANELAHSMAAARLVTVFGSSHDHAVVLSKSTDLLNIMQGHLAHNTWFVGDNPTIADVALYSYTAHAPEGGVDLRDFPNVIAWLDRVESLPGFVAMPQTQTEAKKALG